MPKPKPPKGEPPTVDIPPPNESVVLYDPEELPDVPLLPEQADDESDKDEAFDYPDHVVSYHGDQPGRSAHERVPGH